MGLIRHNRVNQMISYSTIVLFIFMEISINIKGVLCNINTDGNYISGVGDPGMRRDNLRVAIESWNQCNEVGEEAPFSGSPRLADCFDIYTTTTTSQLINSKGAIFLSSYHLFNLYLFIYFIWVVHMRVIKGYFLIKHDFSYMS